MCPLTYPAVGSTTRSGIPVDAPWFTAGPSWSRINTSSWQISVTKWRCSYEQTDQRETWNIRAADKHFSRNQTLILCFSPELCRCDRSGQLTWLWSGNMHVSRKNMFILSHFYCCFELSDDASHSQSKKLQLGESLLVELVLGTPLLSSWRQRDGHCDVRQPTIKQT